MRERIGCVGGDLVEGGVRPEQRKKAAVEDLEEGRRGARRVEGRACVERVVPEGDERLCGEDVEGARVDELRWVGKECLKIKLKKVRSRVVLN